MKHLQKEKCQWQAWAKDALVFLVQKIWLIWACIWHMNTQDTVHNLELTFQAGHSNLANTLYP